MYFQIKYSSFVAEILSFSFYLVNSECGTYLAVDQSLAYASYPIMFLLFFSLILSLIPVLKPPFLIHVLVFLLDVLEFCHLVYLFLIHIEMSATHFKPRKHNYLNLAVVANFYFMLISVISLSARTFLSLVLHTKRHFPYQQPHKCFFSIAAYIFRNLFWKICPLFGKKLITCLKCFRVSFSLFSYSKKMRWGRGWNL